MCVFNVLVDYVTNHLLICVFNVLVDYVTNHLTDAFCVPDFWCGLLFSQIILNIDAKNTSEDCTYVFGIADATTNRSVSVAETKSAVYSKRKQASNLGDVGVITGGKVGSWEGYNARTRAPREYSA